MRRQHRLGSLGRAGRDRLRPTPIRTDSDALDRGPDAGSTDAVMLGRPIRPWAPSSGRLQAAPTIQPAWREGRVAVERNSNTSRSVGAILGFGGHRRIQGANAIAALPDRQRAGMAGPPPTHCRTSPAAIYPFVLSVVRRTLSLLDHHAFRLIRQEDVDLSSHNQARMNPWLQHNATRAL